uniref:Uncharacterized protein n=1 Tax=Acrobeloides nanus TaxID=290746 RepID=A0A914DMA7_9BILA
MEFGVVSHVQPKFDQALYSREIDSLLYLESKLERLRESSYNPTHESDDIRGILRRPSELKNADKYEIPQEWPINLDEIFKDLDQRKICSFYEALDSVLNVRPKRQWLAVDLILIVEAAKTLPFFDKLNEDDKRIGLNTAEYVLLKTIIYCYSYIVGLSSYAREILNKEREKYAFTLLRYMQAQLGTMEGAKKYAEVISLVETFFYFAQRHREMLLMGSLINNTKLTMSPIIEKILLK